MSDELGRKLEEAERASSQARMKTNLAVLKSKLSQMQLAGLKTSDYEAFKNLEARIKEMEEVE